MQAQHQHGLNISRLSFAGQIVGYGDQLGEILHGLTIDQWEGLAELTASHHAQLKLRASSFGS